jgi:Tol biopolymer transport system component
LKRLVLLLAVCVVPGGCSSPDPHDDPTLAAAFLSVPSAAAYAGLVGTDSVTTRTWRISAGAEWELPFDISADGRRALVIDPEPHGNDLAIQDLATGELRTVMAIADLATPEYPWGVWYGARFSPDGERVAFWYSHYSASRVNYPELRVVRTDGEPALDEVLGPMMPGGWGQPLRWSPDGTWILTWREEEDGRQQLVLVPAAGGEPRVLMALGYEAPTGADFSPDGRFVAYDLPATENGYAHHIHVVAVDGSGHWTLVRHHAQDLFLGWSGDGYVYFSSDRTRSGAPGVWRIPVREGHATGPPELVKPDVHVRSGTGFDDHGRLYYRTRVGSREVRIASIDPVTGSFGLSATSPFQDYAASGAPAWSPEGRFLAAQFALYGRRMILIRSMETGEVRELPLPPRISNVIVMDWTGDGRWLFFPALHEGRRSLLRVDVGTGAAESTVMEGLTWAVGVPGTNRILLKFSLPSEVGWLTPWMVYDPDTGEEPTPLDISHPIHALAVSPDGSMLAAALYVVEGASGNSIRVYPMEGGEGRELVAETPFPVWRDSFAFTPDGSGLYYATNAETDEEIPRRAIRPWIVDVSGGEPRPLDLVPWLTTAIRPHPDGTRVATIVGEPIWEFWVMEDMAPVQRRGGGGAAFRP